MCKRILSVAVSVSEGAPAMKLQFHPGINILWGQNAENVVLSLAGMSLLVSGEDGRNIVDGSRLPDGFAGAGDLLLKKLRESLTKEDDLPLCIYGFLERLDEAIDLQPIFKALNAAGRQVFIAVPQYYRINTWEEMYHDTAIHTL